MSGPARALWLLVALLGAAAACDRRELGPAPVAFDRVPCARCRMLVGEPGFAAQLRTRAGEERFFDDPGCLLLHLDETGDAVSEAYVHHADEPRWIPLAAAGFVARQPTPMGYGLAAVDRDVAGAIPLEAAREQVRTQELARRRPR